MIEKERLDRLWLHLMKLQSLTGMPLRRTYGFTKTHCPIYNFAPPYDQQGYKVAWCGDNGGATYLLNEGGVVRLKRYSIFEQSDSDWWRGLPPNLQREITDWVERKLGEEDEHKPE